MKRLDHFAFGVIVGLVCAVIVILVIVNAPPKTSDMWKTKQECQQSFVDLAYEVCRDLP